jgi:phosphonoacetaldehyde hydrolase
VNGVKLVVLDWAGTTVDHGSMAPLAPFVGAFAAHGVAITAAEARAPTGLAKRDHIRALLRDSEIARRWRLRHGRDWTEADAAGLYDRFVPLQLEMIDNHGRPVPHLLPAVEALRRAGVRIGATTGYFRAAAERVCAAARAQGYAPDACACAEEVPAGGGAFTAAGPAREAGPPRCRPVRAQRCRRGGNPAAGRRRGKPSGRRVRC